MIDSIDHIVIAVSNIQQAEQEYVSLLGRAPSWQGGIQNYGGLASVFQLSNCAIVLCQPDKAFANSGALLKHIEKAGEGVYALVFSTLNLPMTTGSLGKGKIELASQSLETRPEPGYAAIKGELAEIPEDTFVGLKAYIYQAEDCLDKQHSKLLSGLENFAAVYALDHLVVNTPDADELKHQFASFHLNLRLDQNIEKWGARQLFYRIGNNVLEVMAFNDEKMKPKKNEYWGLALKTIDVEACHQRMLKQGISLSGVRAGRKPGTQVATIKSHQQGVATLLIGPDHP